MTPVPLFRLPAVLLLALLAASHGGAAQELPDADALFAQAVARHQAGDVIGAIEYYQAALQKEPARVDARSNLGAAYARLGRYDEAAEQYRQALAQAGDQAAVRFNLALALFKSARVSDAATELERVVAADPGNRAAVLLLADCQLQLGRDAAVVELLGPREEDLKDDRLFIYLMGTALVRANDLQRGQGYIDRLFREGDPAEAHLLMGATHLRKNDYMDFGGFNNRLITPIVDRVKSVGGAIAVVMFTALGFNIVAGDQYIAIVLPARMFMVEFRKRGLHPETLATAVENSGTLTSPLIPWNSCGAYMTATLGVSTFMYLPYCFFNFINFIMGLIFGFTGLNVMRLPSEEALPAEPLAAVPLVVQDK